MMMERKQLVDVLTKICSFAQNHSGDEEAWGPRNSSALENWMQHTSFVVACFLAQNTLKGSGGVDWDVVQQELVGPVLTKEQWKKIVEKLVKELSGE